MRDEGLSGEGEPSITVPHETVSRTPGCRGPADQDHGHTGSSMIRLRLLKDSLEHRGALQARGGRVDDQNVRLRGVDILVLSSSLPSASQPQFLQLRQLVKRCERIVGLDEYSAPFSEVIPAPGASDQKSSRVRPPCTGPCPDPAHDHQLAQNSHLLQVQHL